MSIDKARPDGTLLETVPEANGAVGPQRQAEDSTSQMNSTASIGQFEALKNRNFRLLALGSFLTSAADWFQTTTISWTVYDLTGSGALLGLILGVRVIPGLLMTPVVGVLADRYSRQRLISGSQFALFCFTFVMAIGLILDVVEIWHLFVFVVLTTLANTVNMPARQAMVYDVVTRDVLPNAVAWNSIAANVSRALGPALAGIVIVFSGAVTTNFLLQSLFYLGIMVTVLMIRLPERSVSARPSSRGYQSFLKDLGEGYSFVVNNRQARMLALVMLISPLLLIPVHQALVPIYAKQVFHSDASAVGIMLSAMGVGTILGALIITALNRVDRRGLLQVFSLILFAASHSLFAFVGYATGSLLLASGFLVLSGLAEGIYIATNQTVLQLLAPDNLRGRVISVLQFSNIIWVGTALLAGIGADHFGAPAMAMTQGVSALLIGIALLSLSPTLRNLRLSRLGLQEVAIPVAQNRAP